jgi:multidrug efflux system membrane fusion protein
MPVSVAIVDRRETALWDEFSGRLEAIDRVDIRPRVSGVVQAVHFREGALVKQGDLLFTLDRAPYLAEVERAEAQLAGAKARVSVAKNELERGQQLVGSKIVSAREFDQRENAYREAEANVRAAEATLQTMRLSLEYTEVRAPVTGRVGKIEVTAGNLIAAGAGAPLLTTLVSTSPIYASFNVDEEVVARAIHALGKDKDAHTQVDRIPVEMGTAGTDGTPHRGQLQFIDNQVNAASGTVRARAVFDNPTGTLMPGQFARLRLGRTTSQQMVLVDERAIGTDQSKKFVLTVGDDNKAAYREVQLGPVIDGMRIVTAGLEKGERIIVNGLQRVRPGALVAPQLVSMTQRFATATQGATAAE